MLSGVFVYWCEVCSLVCLFIGVKCVLMCVCSLVFSGVFQESGLPTGAIIAISVMSALVLCLIIVLVWFANKKMSMKSVGESMSQL